MENANLVIAALTLLVNVANLIASIVATIKDAERD